MKNFSGRRALCALSILSLCASSFAAPPLVQELEHFDYFYANSLKEAEESRKAVESGDILYKELPSGEKKFSGYKSGKLSAEEITAKSYERQQRKKEKVEASAPKRVKRATRIRANRSEDPAIYKRVISKSKVGIRYTGEIKEKVDKRLRVDDDKLVGLDEVINNRRYARKVASDKPNKPKAAKGVARSARVSAINTLKSKRQSVEMGEAFLRSAPVEARTSSRLVKSQSVSLEQAYALRTQPKEVNSNKKDINLKAVKRVSAVETLAAARRYRAAKDQAYADRLEQALENPVEIAPKVVVTPAAAPTNVLQADPVTPEASVSAVAVPTPFKVISAPAPADSVVTIPVPTVSVSTSDEGAPPPPPIILFD